MRIGRLLTRVQKLEQIAGWKEPEPVHQIIQDPDDIWRVWVCPVREGCECGGFGAEWKGELPESLR
jgi:hypothetical protein